MRTHYVHYSAKPLALDRARTYAPLPERSYFKPHGLWLSAEGHEDDQTWRTWCEGERVFESGLRYAAEVTLDERRLLVVSGEQALRDFHQTYARPVPLLFDRYPDWALLTERYAGIVIAPYVWGLRMEAGFMWYYSWDCASACVWDLSAVVSVGESVATNHAVEKECGK